MTDWSVVDRLLLDAVGPVFPAAQLVVADEGKIVLERAVGDCTAATLFDVASLTKPLCTTFLTMIFVERERLSLDDQPRAGITVRHLLAHASGLPAWLPLYAEVSNAPAGEFRRRILEEPLDTRPGTRAVYSDLGFMLLGMWLEDRTGEFLEVLFDTEIAKPIRTGARFFPDNSQICAPTENGLRGIVHDENARALGGAAGHAGLFANARDVSAIVSSLVGAWSGQRGILRPETVRLFWSSSGVEGSTWCLGWDRPSDAGSQAGALWPRDGVGHLGFTGCSLWVDPSRRRWVVLLSNRVCPTRENERIKEFRPVLHDAIVKALDVGQSFR